MGVMNAFGPYPPASGPWTVLGLMSGTSADGTDAALVSVDPKAFQSGDPFLGLLGHAHHPYEPALRETVLAAAGDRLRPSELCILQRELAASHATAGRKLLKAMAMAPHLACLHGQTVQHHPDRGATLQLADPYVLSESLGCPVVWDLRRRDLALGGQGAPLVPLTELWLRGRSTAWAALNLGGIANVTLWDGSAILAWDLGPAMSLLDLAAQRWLNRPFDPEGAHATGTPVEDRLRAWLTHPYFQVAPPKSTGREVFGEAWLTQEAPALEGLPLADRLASLAAFTAEACAQELRRWSQPLPVGSKLWISGGGARHARLRRELALRLPELQIAVDDAFPAGAREAVSWALLGAASAAGVPGNLPAVTGAVRPEILGSWTGRPSLP